MSNGFVFRTQVYPIDTYDGESLRTAGDKINLFTQGVSGDVINTINTFHDAHQSNVQMIRFDQCDSTVVDHVTGMRVDYTTQENVMMEKLFQLPFENRVSILEQYFNSDLYTHKIHQNDVVRALYLDDSTGKWKFANNKALYDNNNNLTGVIGNVYPTRQCFELVTNGLFYDFGHTTLVPGQVYFLTDSLPGFMVPYQEGGGGQNVSVPFAIGIHPRAGVLLTDRAVIKDMACYDYCAPHNLSFTKDVVYTEYVDVTDGDPFNDPNVIKYQEYTSIAGVQQPEPYVDPWTDPSVTKYTLYVEI